MALAPITERERDYVKDEIKLDDSQMQTKIEQLKEWMKKQPHLPEVPEKVLDKMLYAFLVGTKMSAESTKHKIDTYYAMRHQLPEIFQKRDPTQQDIRDSAEIIYLFPVAELTPDCIRVNIMSFTTDKDKRFTTKDMKAMFKRAMAIGDVRLQSDEFCLGEYVVVDCRGLHFSHVTEVPWLFAQRFAALCQEALPVRVKGVFMINAPPFTETIVNVLKPAFNDKVKKRIQIFRGDHTKLYKFIPQRILPSDFGGDAPSIKESSRAWQRSIESMRDFFIEDEKRITNEEKRPRDSVNDCGQLFGINGTFNKLNID